MSWAPSNGSGRFNIHPFYNYVTYFDFGGAAVDTNRVQYSVGSTLKYLYQPILMTFKKSNTGNAKQKIAFNGNIVATCTSCSGVLDVTTSTSFSIGLAFDGLLGEIIFFNRSLNSEETAAIESYLKQKWNILN